MTNFEYCSSQRKKLLEKKFALQENAEHLKNHNTTFLNITIDSRYDQEYNEDLDIIEYKERKELIYKINLNYFY